MKYSILAACLALSGCASLQFAGNSSYSVKPFIDASGAAICCDISIKDGKERASLTVNIAKHGDDYTLSFDEKGVLAFQGQAIASDNVKAIADIAAKAALAALLAPIALPAVGAAAASGSLGAIAVGGAAAIEAQKLNSVPK